ncbi:hypothetical protein chiPu_0014015 [Chiloscyllium punctatum]|uniref:Glycosyltransferase 2-like domain-containing protein n=1 Tax=Chiloscyllium punctatum TaxID=137246 RepID=A0A401SYQ6_CHIPU|nr:hypothetical protein [Chiloscyllium punctatum]
MTVLLLFQVTRPPWLDGAHAQAFDEKAYLLSKTLKPGDDPYGRHAFNQQESDRLPSDRAIRDTRHYRCSALQYSPDLPVTSVIITFHNEARSTLLRTVKRYQHTITSHMRCPRHRMSRLLPVCS